MNIILIGFMGSGKSTFGKFLAERLGYTFFDTDKAIQAQENRSISEIFETEGETHFRTLETQLCERFSSLDQHIIATGGGLPIQSENQAYLKASGKIIFLKAPIESLISRALHSKKRPLAQDETAFKTLYAQRKDIYQSLADQTFDIESKNLNDAKESLLSVIKAMV